SLMRGVDSIESLCAAAARAGAKAMALTDVNALYGAPRFWEIGGELGLTPLLGADIVTPSAPWATASRALLLTARGRGHRRPRRPMTECHRDDYSRTPMVFSLEKMLLEDREGLWVLSEPKLIDRLARGSGTTRLAVVLSPGAPHRSRGAALELARRG